MDYIPFDDNIFDRLETPEARMALAIGIGVLQEANQYEKRTGRRASTFVLRFQKPLNPHPEPQPGSRIGVMGYTIGFEVKIPDDDSESPPTK
jgi:hypothetical protein